MREIISLKASRLNWCNARDIKKIAVAFDVTTDWLIFEEGERALPNSRQLKFEAVSQISEEDQRAIQSFIDGMILKHTASQLVAGRA